jgi:N utilization substance protein A
MPAIQRSEFALALNQVATERGVDVEVVLDTVRNAILAAYRKDHPGVEVEEYSAELNPNTGEASILHNGTDVTPPGFGRIAAQTAKQVILQKIREKEKEAIISDYKDKLGQIVNGTVLRFAGPNIIVDIGKTEAIMPSQEQIRDEKYYQNQRLVVFIKDIREGTKGEEVIVSRADNGLLEGLFKREVPEVSQNSVIIKAIVREPGNRSKVSVASTQSGIDPVGSCVGQKGVRVQAIIQEVGGIEKIDIIQWQDDITNYVAAALSPAKNVQVRLNEEEKVATVIVPQEELSLAIGKDGQNVRLASKLTGYRIEIEGAELPQSDEPKETKDDNTPKDIKNNEEVKDTVEAEEQPEIAQDVEQEKVLEENEASETPVDAPDASAEESIPPTNDTPDQSKEETTE